MKNKSIFSRRLEVPKVTNLLGAMMVQPYYDELRTNQHVQAGTTTHARVPGIQLIVQSPNASVEQIEKSNDLFIQQFSKVLEKLTDEDLNVYKQPLISRLVQKPASLGEDDLDFWTQIRRGHLKFDLKEKNIRVLKEISMADIKKLYQEIIIDNARSISVVAEGDKENPSKLFTDYKRYQKQHATDFPVWTAQSTH